MMSKIYYVLLIATYNPFSLLQNGVGNEEQLSKLNNSQASIYNFFMVLAVIGLACSFTWYGARLALTKNPQARQEVKESITVKFMLAIVIFASVFILNLILKLATSFT